MGKLRLMTPTRRTLLMLVAAVTLATVPSFWATIMEESSRGHYPWFADSIGLVLLPQAVVAMIAAPLLVALVALVVRKSILPAPLLLWDQSRPIRSWVVTISSALVVAIGVYAIAEALWYGLNPYLIPVAFGWVVVAILVRGAALALPGKTAAPRNRL